MSEESTPKAGGVKAMLAALNAKKSHVVLPDGTVPGGKASWNTPKKDPAAPAQPKPNSSAASKDEPAGKRHAPAEGGMESPGSGSLTQDEMRAVREAVAAKRGAGQSPAAGRGRGGSATPGSEKFTQPSSDTALRGPLPEGWHEKTDPTTGQVFWVNHEKKLRSWTDPRLPRQASGRGRGRGGLAGGRGEPPTAGRLAEGLPGRVGGQPPAPPGRGTPPAKQLAIPPSSPAAQKPLAPLGPPAPGTGAGHCSARRDLALLPTGGPDSELPEGIARVVDVVYRGVGTYSGGVKDGERHGRGTFQFVNGDTYNGEWCQGKPSGYGEYTWQAGGKYAGDWVDGKHDGRGFLSWGPDPNSKKEKRYTGSFRRGSRAGSGSETIAGHGVYAGQWEADQRSGRGTFKWDNGNLYDGDWSADQRSGTGLFVWPSGRRYEGTFYKDCPVQGLLQEADGTCFAVKFEPNNAYEIERDPPPVEKLMTGRREYAGPRYSPSASVASSSPVTKASPGPSSALTGSNLRGNYISLPSPGDKTGNHLSNASTYFSLRREPADSNVPTSIRREAPDSSVGLTAREGTVGPRVVIRAVAKPVRMCLKLSIDYGSTGEEGSGTRASFESDLTQDLSHATGHSPNSFCVRKLSAGSVHADIDIMPDSSDSTRDPFAAAGNLAEQAKNPQSRLRTGKITCALEAISFPSLKQSISIDQQAPPATPPAAEKPALQQKISPKSSGHAVDCECDHCFVDRAPPRLASVEAPWSSVSSQRLPQASAVSTSGRSISSLASPTSGAFPVVPIHVQQQVPWSNVDRLQTSRDTAVAAAGAPRPGYLGISVKQVEQRVIVSDKSTGSPSAYSQRLRVGDQVLKVDHVDVSHMALQAVREKLDGAPYTTVKLEMKSQHDGQTYECALQRAEAPLFTAGQSSQMEAFSYKLVMDLFPTPNHAAVSPDVQPSSGATVVSRQSSVQQPSPELVPRIIPHSPVARSSSRSPLIPEMEPPASRPESLAGIPQQRDQGTTTAQVKLELGLPFPSTGTQGSHWRAGFMQDFLNDVTRALGCAVSSIIIKSLHPGEGNASSIIILEMPATLAQQVMDQAADSQSFLRAGAITCRTERAVILIDGVDGDTQASRGQPKSRQETGHVAGQVDGFAPHQSIGMLLKRPSNSPSTIIVKDVMPGSLADGNIIQGDVITQLNGIDVTSISLKAVSELLAESKALRQVICVDVLRQGRPFQVFLDTSLCSSAAPIPAQELLGARAPSLYSSVARSVAPMERESVDLFASAALSARPSSSSQTQLRGIGLLLLLVSDQVQIQKVRPGSHADRLGVIFAGDLILAIDEETIDGQRDRLGWAKARILGVAGTQVSLRLQPARGSAPFTVVVVREGGISTGRAEDDIGYVVSKASHSQYDPFPGTLTTACLQPEEPSRRTEACDSFDLPTPIPMPDGQVQAAPQQHYNSPGALESVLMTSSPGYGNGSNTGADPGETSSPDAQIEQLSTSKPIVIDSRPRVLTPVSLVGSSDPAPSNAGHISRLETALYSPEKTGHVQHLTNEIYSPSSSPAVAPSADPHRIAAPTSRLREDMASGGNSGMGVLEHVAKTDFSFLLEEGLGSPDQIAQKQIQAVDRGFRQEVLEYRNQTNPDLFGTRSSHLGPLPQGKPAKYKDPRFPGEPDLVIG